MGLDTTPVDGIEEPATPEPQRPPVASEPLPAPAAPAEPRVTTTALAVLPGSDAWALQLEPTTLRGAAWLAAQVHNSRLFAFPNEEAALIAIVRGRELGIPAMSALAGMHVIKSKLTLSAHTIIGLVAKSPLCTFIRCTASSETSATWRTLRRGYDGPSELTFTLGEAERMGLTGPTTNWAKIPARMLEKTAGVMLARREYPDVAGGLYMPEELT